MRAKVLPVLGVAAGLLLSVGCAPTVEQANARFAELCDVNSRAESAALAREVRRRGVRLAPRRAALFLVDKAGLDACSYPGGAGGSFRLESPQLELEVTVSCSELHAPGTLWTGKLADGSPVVLLRSRFSYALQGQRVLVFKTEPHVTRRERVVYPGSCNEMPSPPRFGLEFSLVIFGGRRKSDFHFVPVPYDAVDIDRTCEHPKV